MNVNMHFLYVLRAVFDDCQLCPTSQSQGISVINCVNVNSSISEDGPVSLSYFLLNWKAQATTTATTTKTSLETCCYSTSLDLSNVVGAGGFFPKDRDQDQKKEKKIAISFSSPLKNVK